jgi:hypothetical protein
LLGIEYGDINVISSMHLLMKKILISFTLRQYKILHDEKEKTGCSIGSIVRIALEHHFQKWREGAE